MSGYATHLADQLQAASEQVTAGINTLVLDLGYAPATAAWTLWLRHLVTSTVGDGAGSMRACRHVKAMRSPGPVFLAAHRRRLECYPCSTESARAVAGTAEDERCDVCGRVTARLACGAIAVGPYLVTVGACPPCRPTVTGGTW